MSSSTCAAATGSAERLSSSSHRPAPCGAGCVPNTPPHRHGRLGQLHISGVASRPIRGVNPAVRGHVHRMA